MDVRQGTNCSFIVIDNINKRKEEKMTNINDLKSIVMLNNLKVSMLEKLSNITSIKTYKANDYIFNEGDDAKNLYAVIEGKVRLEIDKKYVTRISINDIIHGMAFGFSALVDTEKKCYTTFAKALTDVKLFKWKATDLEALFNQDFEMGFLFMKEIAKIIKARLKIRNIQFLDIYK
jgi:CRP-like cAMP-binding protein